MTNLELLKRGLGFLGFACLAGAAACSSKPQVHTVLTPSPSAAVRAAIESATTTGPGAYPTFADIPKAPAGQRTPEQWDAAQAALSADAAGLQREIAAMPTVESARAANTAAFDALARRIAAVPPAPANARAQAEAFARDLKARATPPPRRPVR